MKWDIYGASIDMKKDKTGLKLSKKVILKMKQEEIKVEQILDELKSCIQLKDWEINDLEHLLQNKSKDLESEKNRI